MELGIFQIVDNVETGRQLSRNVFCLHLNTRPDPTGITSIYVSRWDLQVSERYRLHARAMVSKLYVSPANYGDRQLVA